MSNCFSLKFDEHGKKVMFTNAVGFDWNTSVCLALRDFLSMSIDDFTNLRRFVSSNTNEILGILDIREQYRDDTWEWWNRVHSLVEKKYVRAVARGNLASREIRNLAEETLLLTANPYDRVAEPHIEKVIKPPRYSDGYVYVIQPKDSYLYKIGQTSDIEKRMKHFYVAYPHGVNQIVCIKSPNYRDIERMLHERYDAVRDIGEWFALTDDHLQEIFRIKEEIEADQ